MKTFVSKLLSFLKAILFFFTFKVSLEADVGTRDRSDTSSREIAHTSENVGSSGVMEQESASLSERSVTNEQ